MQSDPLKSCAKSWNPVRFAVTSLSVWTNKSPWPCRENVESEPFEKPEGIESMELGRAVYYVRGFAVFVART